MKKSSIAGFILFFLCLTGLFSQEKNYSEQLITVKSGGVVQLGDVKVEIPAGALKEEGEIDKIYIANFLVKNNDYVQVEEDFDIEAAFQRQNEDILSFKEPPYVCLPNDPFRYSVEFTVKPSENGHYKNYYALFEKKDTDDFVYYHVRADGPNPSVFFTNDLAASCNGNCKYGPNAKSGDAKVDPDLINITLPIKFAFQATEEEVDIKVLINNDVNGVKELAILMVMMIIFLIF